MNLIPFVHEGLGNSSYIVDLGNGSAAVIDPDRSIDRYVRTLNEHRLVLKTIFETHVHADFVSGAHELAAQTGATIFVPAEAGLKLPHQGLEGGQSVQLNGSSLTAIGSPGHTPEHLSYVLRSPSAPPLLFSGGSLIVGGAARTDLIASELTDGLARAQFRTIKEAFAELPNETLLLPTHGGGSFCSTGAGGDRSSTLGHERASNPLLTLDDEDEFAEWFPSTFPQAPDYFFRLRAFNQAGPRLRREIPEPRALSPDKFDEARGKALVVDGRQKEAYSSAHIPGSLSNPFRDSFGVWLGWVVDLGTPLLFVLDGEPLQSVLDECLLVGFENFEGYLEGGIEAWEHTGRPLTITELIDATEAKQRVDQGVLLLDVREPSEFEAGHLPNASHIPLGRLKKDLASVPKNVPTLVYCGHGERASTAASLLENAGVRSVANLDGGTGAWDAAGFRLERSVVDG